MDKTTFEIRLASWKPIIEQCQARPKNQTARQWLAEKECSVKTVLLLAAKSPAILGRGKLDCLKYDSGEAAAGNCVC